MPETPIKKKETAFRNNEEFVKQVEARIKKGWKVSQDDSMKYIEIKGLKNQEMLDFYDRHMSRGFEMKIPSKWEQEVVDPDYKAPTTDTDIKNYRNFNSGVESMKADSVPSLLKQHLLKTGYTESNTYGSGDTVTGKTIYTRAKSTGINPDLDENGNFKLADDVNTFTDTNKSFGKTRTINPKAKYVKKVYTKGNDIVNNYELAVPPTYEGKVPTEQELKDFDNGTFYQVGATSNMKKVYVPYLDPKKVPQDGDASTVTANNQEMVNRYNTAQSYADQIAAYKKTDEYKNTQERRAKVAKVKNAFSGFKIDLNTPRQNAPAGTMAMGGVITTPREDMYVKGGTTDKPRFPVGTIINVANDVNDLPSFSNPYLGVINTGLNRIKPKVPIMGDLAVNILQEGLQRGDEEYAPNDFKAKKYLKEKGIDPKNIGYIKPFADGGKVPIKVTDPNDPRLRAYNDSNDLYNSTNLLKKNIIKYGSWNTPKELNLYKKNVVDLSKVNREGLPDNRPIGKTDIDVSYGKNTDETKRINRQVSFNMYKKPVQPYVYEKSKPVIEQNIQQPIVQEQQFQPDIVNTVTPQAKTKLYQGYDFMQETGLRPGDYTEQQVQDAMKAKGTKKLANIYAKGGKTPYKTNIGLEYNKTNSDYFNPAYYNQLGNQDIEKSAYTPENIRLNAKTQLTDSRRQNFPVTLEGFIGANNTQRRDVKDYSNQVGASGYTTTGFTNRVEPVIGGAVGIGNNTLKRNYSNFSFDPNSKIGLSYENNKLSPYLEVSPELKYDINNRKKNIGSVSINPHLRSKFEGSDMYEGNMARDPSFNNYMTGANNLGIGIKGNVNLGNNAYLEGKYDINNIGNTVGVKIGKKFAKGGRVLPKFKGGGWNGVDASGNAIQTNFANSTAGKNVVTGAGIAGSVVPMLTSFIPDDKVTDSEGNEIGSKVNMGKGVLNSAAQGASMGAIAGPVGALVGGGLGALYGGITTFMGNNDVEEAQKQANIGIQNKNLSNKFLTNQNNYSVNRYNNNQMIAANGGTVIDEDMGNPNAELELNETFRDPMTGETGMVDGPSHDDGGIEMSLAEGTQIWSDRLKHNGRTFASLTKPIINKIAVLEKGTKDNPNSRFKQNSIKLLNSQLDFFFNVQESNKQQDEMKRTLKKQEGGVVDDMGNYHYANGGIYIKPENRNKFGMGGMMKYPDGGVKRKNISTSTFEPRALTPFPSLSQKDISEQLILNNAGDNLDTPIPRTLNNFDSKNYNTFMGGFKNDLNNVRNYKMGFGQPNENAWDKKEYSFGPNGAGGDQYTFDKIGKPTYQEPVTQSENNSRVRRNNNGELIQAAALAGSSFAELNNINRQAAPGVRSNVRLTGNIPNPRYVDLSAERGAINRSAMNAMGDAQRSFGNSASAQAFKNKARINQLEGAGKSYQTQENLNSDIYNKFAGMQGEAAMKEAMMNNEIENANLENRFNFAQSKMKGQNAAYATLGHGVGDIGRNRTIFSNDMEKANVLSNQYESSVLADIYKRNPQLLEEAWNSGQISKKAYDKYKNQPQAKYGGTIKTRSLKY
jgi:hypothetical protein